jgi:hypothetical protein
VQKQQYETAETQRRLDEAFWNSPEGRVRAMEKRLAAEGRSVEMSPEARKQLEDYQRFCRSLGVPIDQIPATTSTTP